MPLFVSTVFSIVLNRTIKHGSEFGFRFGILFKASFAIDKGSATVRTCVYVHASYLEWRTISSSSYQERRILNLLGDFDASLAKNCAYKASSCSTCLTFGNFLTPRWIESRKSGMTIAYRVQLETPQYFMLSHPLSRFKRSEPYWVGYDDAKFCTQLGLVPTFALNLNKFTLLRLWGELARSLFSPRAEPIPEEDYVYWKMVPQSGRLPEFSSMNFILKQSAEMKVYEGSGCTCFEDYFTFGFWSFPERGFSDSTVVINDDSAVHLVLKASKSLYIPTKTYVVNMDLGLEKQIPVEMLTLWGLRKEKGEYYLKKIDNVVLTKGVADTLEKEQKRGRFIINGIVSEFRKRERRFPTLTAVALYEVSNLELIMSLIGLVVSQRFQESINLSRVGTSQDIKRETEHVLSLLLQKTSLDRTFADSMPDQFSLALEYLAPIVIVNEGDVFYMHPSVYISLMERGLFYRLGKNQQDIVDVLRILDMISSKSDAEILRSKESVNLRGRGFFPEIVLSCLKMAVKQIQLSRIQKSLLPEILESTHRDIKEDISNLSSKEQLRSVRSPTLQSAIIIMNKKERRVFRYFREIEKKLRKAKRDR